VIDVISNQLVVYLDAMIIGSFSRVKIQLGELSFFLNEKCSHDAVRINFIVVLFPDK